MENNSPPLVLAIDTSGPRLQLALAGDALSEILVEEIAKGHAEILFDRIGAILDRISKTYQDLTRIAVTTGPGSFTGLRIGISAARGLGLSLGLPVIGVPNLLALSFGQGDAPLDVVLDARRDEYFVQHFSGDGAPTSKATLMPAQDAQNTYPREGIKMISNPKVDIARLASFALLADPASYPPDPTYIRAADAKPQSGKQIERA